MSKFHLSYDILHEEYQFEEILNKLLSRIDHCLVSSVERPVKSTLMFESTSSLTTLCDLLQREFPNLYFVLSEIKQPNGIMKQPDLTLQAAVEKIVFQRFLED